MTEFISKARVSNLSVRLSQIMISGLRLLLNTRFLFFIIALLLSRAIILNTVSPFALAFLATAWLGYRNHSLFIIAATFIGSFTVSNEQVIFIFLSTVFFLILVAIFNNQEGQKRYMPLFVFLCTIIPRMFLYSLSGQLSYYEGLLLFVEGILALVLVLIFMQSIPFLFKGTAHFTRPLKHEEVISLLILLASILTGLVGLTVYSLAFEQVFARLLVLSVALVGGAAIGSTVGVIIGFILSLAELTNLYQVSLLAFSGLLGGLLKDGKKLGVSIGLLVGTLFINVYGEAQVFLTSFYESSLAILIFFLLPTTLFLRLSRYIPGTEVYEQEQEQYVQKVRNITAKRVEQFSNVFAALSRSFLTTEEKNEARTTEKERDYFLSEITEKTCQQCFMKERCWQRQFDQTYLLMTLLKEELTSGEVSFQTKRKFENHCVKSAKVMQVMKEEVSIFDANQRLKKQVKDSKRLVADQLLGVSQVMDDFSKEILKEKELYDEQEEQILAGLKDLGLEIEKLDIFQLEKGNVDLEIVASFYEYHGEGEKLIAPFLSELLDELIVVREETVSPFPNGYCFLAFHSAKRFVVETGLAHAAKGGGLISGDSYTEMDLGVGKKVLAISDGMGNGKRAKEESEETLRLLHQILKTGIPEQVAIKSINSILSLRTTDEIYSTLDLTIMNLHNASIRCLKIGSSPSFIKRGNFLFQITASNLPIGIIEDFSVDIVQEQLKPGDLLIMMSDGVYDGPRLANKDLWFREKLQKLENDHPQHVADYLLEEIIRENDGYIFDDMTVLVAKINRNTPKWTSIPLYSETGP